MITDWESNFVYFADTLPKKHPRFFRALERVLKRRKIAYGLLPGTKAIWCRDYMPIQVSRKSFVQFQYKPSYLKTKEELATITDTASVCKAIGIKPVVSDIKLDGGNLVRSKDRAIMTDQVFSENPGYSKKALIRELKSLLRLKHVVMLPKHEDDKFGHADGMMRFVGDGKKEVGILMNDYSRESRGFKNAIYRSFEEEKMPFLFLSYDPYNNKTSLDSTGIYINYLQVGQTIIYPIYGLPSDTLARKKLLYDYGSNAVPLMAREIAEEGGVLNCISWNIRA